MMDAIMKLTAKNEADWQAESDARVIEQYHEIIKDKKRLDKALKAAEKTIDNLTERIEALSKSVTGIKNKK